MDELKRNDEPVAPRETDCFDAMEPPTDEADKQVCDQLTRLVPQSVKRTQILQPAFRILHWTRCTLAQVRGIRSGLASHAQRTIKERGRPVHSQNDFHERHFGQVLSQLVAPTRASVALEYPCLHERH